MLHLKRLTGKKIERVALSHKIIFFEITNRHYTGVLVINNKLNVFDAFLLLQQYFMLLTDCFYNSFAVA